MISYVPARLTASCALLLLLVTPALGQDAPASRPAPGKEETKLAQPTELKLGHPMKIDLAPGSSRTFSFTPTVDGEVSTWARSDTLDVTLRASNAEGKAIAFDDDSGGGNAAHFITQAKKGGMITLLVEAKATEADSATSAPTSHTAALAAIETPYSIDLERLVDSISKATREMSGKRAGGDLVAARRIGAAALEKVLAFDGREKSSRLRFAINSLGFEAWSGQDIAVASRCFSLVLHSRERNLPPEHPGLQESRQNYAVTLDALGDLEGASALFAQVLAIKERTLPPEHPDLQASRLNYVTTLDALGDHGARTPGSTTPKPRHE